MEEKHAPNRRIIMLIVLVAVLLAFVIGTLAQPEVNVDADDVVKITKIVNYKDKTGGRVFHGAKMNIIIFKRGG